MEPLRARESERTSDVFEPRVPPLAELRSRRSEKWQTHASEVLPLSVAEMDFDLAPAVKRVLTDAIEQSDTGYATRPDRLGEIVSEFAQSRWTWNVDPTDVTAVAEVGVGCVELLRVVCRPGDEVVVNPPVYPPFFDWVHEIGGRVVEVPLLLETGGWRLDLDALATAFARGPAAYILCNPHNPVGRIHATDELGEVVRLAHKHGVTVISDEIHAPLVLPGPTFTPLLTVDGATDIGVSLVSATKGWNFPGLKCAMIVASSASTRELIRQLPSETMTRVGHLGVMATITALTEAVDWLDATRAVLAERRDRLDQALQARLPHIRWVPPEATYLAWLDCRSYGSGDLPYERFLNEAGVALEPGSKFGARGGGWVRLNFGTSTEVLDLAVNRLAAVSPSARTRIQNTIDGHRPS